MRRRQAVSYVPEHHGHSERRICRALHITRSSVRYVPQPRNDEAALTQSVIRLASPWENGYCESFNGKFRDELLNGEIFYTLREAQVVIEKWRHHYNTIRPHSALNYRPPAPEAVLPTIQDVHLKLAA